MAGLLSLPHDPKNALVSFPSTRLPHLTHSHKANATSKLIIQHGYRCPPRLEEPLVNKLIRNGRAMMLQDALCTNRKALGVNENKCTFMKTEDARPIAHVGLESAKEPAIATNETVSSKTGGDHSEQNKNRPSDQAEGEDPPIKCPKCSETFEDQIRLASHAIAHIGISSDISCDLCSWTDSDQSALNRPILEAHPAN